jgi:hypothetical protein
MQTTSVLPLEHNHDAVSDDVAQVQAAQREPAAFVALYDRYRDRIYKYLRTRTMRPT